MEPTRPSSPPGSACAKRAIIAEEHAARVVNYIRVFTISTNFLATDPVERDRFLRAKEQDPSTTPIADAPPHQFIDRVDEALQEYDRQLSVEPKTFEDHIHRSCVAYTAMMHYIHNKLHPALWKDPALRRPYNAAQNRLHNEFLIELGVLSDGPLPPPPMEKNITPPASVSAVPLSDDEARELVKNIDDLMALYFFIDDAGETASWRVIGVTYRVDRDPEYMVFFDDIETDIPMEREELVDYLKHSRRIVK